MIFNLTLLGNFLILLNYHPAEVGSVKKEDSVEVKKEAEDKVYKWNQPQTCEKCGDVLKSLGGLMDHMAAKHGSYEDREYKCDEEGCGKRFIRSSQLEQHKKSAHGQSVSQGVGLGI